LPHGGAWLEPCAGEGAIVRVLAQSGVADHIVASDIRDCKAEQYAAGADRASVADYATPFNEGSVPPRYHVAITNPPYNLADAIVRNMLLVADYVAILTRQGFVGHERASWMRTNMPDTYELPDRPSFARSLKCIGQPQTKTKAKIEPCGWSTMQALTDIKPSRCPECGLRVLATTSDAADYCWLVWTPERDRHAGRRYILPSTSLEERQGQAGQAGQAA
jgi:hypothetical protein